MIRTVTGDIEATELGATDYHEHAFQVSPLLAGDELDNSELSGLEFTELRRSGFDAVIDATPIGLSRRPLALEALARETRLSVVGATGAHRDAHYPSGHPLLDLNVPQLAAVFVRDLQQGMPESDETAAGTSHGPGRTAVRAGIVKTGIDYWAITPFERRVLDAAAAAHAVTGAPIMVHLENGSAALEVLAILATAGVAADAIVLAHVDRNPDPGLHTEIASTGAFIGYDGWARTARWPDSVLLDCLIACAAAGGEGNILLGGDVARRSRYHAYGGMPGLAYLGDRVLPRLVALGGAELVRAITTENPRRLLDRFPGPIEPVVLSRESL
jgi:phosphotriesterase-related protein